MRSFYSPTESDGFDALKQAAMEKTMKDSIKNGNIWKNSNPRPVVKYSFDAIAEMDFSRKYNYSITQNGHPLAEYLYTIDLDKKTFSSEEDNLVFDFSRLSDWVFDTHHNCTFQTGDNCIFKTGMACTFKTGTGCTFNTSDFCSFKTGSSCSFNTSYNCTFTTSDYCNFITADNCTFRTGYNCSFKTTSKCTFMTGDKCTFDTTSFCTFNTHNNCTFDTGNYCAFLIDDINTCKFKSHDDISTILDYKDNKHYILTKELIDILKVTNG